LSRKVLIAVPAAFELERFRTTIVRGTRYSRLSSLRKDEGGVIAVLTGILLTVLIGIVGLAIDVGVWYQTNRALQNAADAAVIAAALDGTDAYASQAKAITAQYGFVDGSNGITVTAANNQTCPDGTTSCYQVTVAQASGPLFFSSVLGLSAPAISGRAMASGGGAHNYCMLTLADLPGHTTTDPGIDGRGLSKADMNGCSVMSNTGASCGGHDLGATYVDAHGTSSGCTANSANQHSNVSQVSDPDASLASNIPPYTCPNYSGTTWAAGGRTLTGTATIANGQIICGTLKLNGDVTVTSSAGLSGAVLIIANGVLNTNGKKLSTFSDSALTIIFSGPDTSGTYNHYPTGGGTLDLMAPTSGVNWKGIAIYQDPALTNVNSVSFTYDGNSPTWNITGVVYLPHAGITFKGIVNKSAFGQSCLLFIADNITMKGTAKIEATTAASCALAGVALPNNNVGATALVM
jgi:Flp pilus assembly protein TadG